MELLFKSGVVFLVAATISAQTVHSIKGSDPNSCNVVNVHFANNGDVSDATADTTFGPPGKRGPIGPVGPQVCDIRRLAFRSVVLNLFAFADTLFSR